MKFPRVALLGVAVMAAVSGCSSSSNTQPEHSQTALMDTLWQLQELYVDADVPLVVPDATAGRAVLHLGARSFSAHTGCAAMQGIIALEQEHLRVESVEVADADAECAGTQQVVHSSMVELLRPGAEFQVLQQDTALILREDAQDAEQLNGAEPRGLRFVAQVS